MKAVRRDSRNQRHVVAAIRGLKEQSTTGTKNAGYFFKNLLGLVKMLHYIIGENNIEGLIGIGYSSGIGDYTFIKVWVGCHTWIKIYSTYPCGNTSEIHRAYYTRASTKI